MLTAKKHNRSREPPKILFYVPVTSPPDPVSDLIEYLKRIRHLKYELPGEDALRKKKDEKQKKEKEKEKEEEAVDEEDVESDYEAEIVRSIDLSSHSAFPNVNFRLQPPRNGEWRIGLPTVTRFEPGTSTIDRGLGALDLGDRRSPEEARAFQLLPKVIAEMVPPRSVLYLISS